MTGCDTCPDMRPGPKLLTHERPDSWERIANELDEWRMAESSSRQITSDAEDVLHDFAERIRRLAEREASNGTD